MTSFVHHLRWGAAAAACALLALPMAGVGQDRAYRLKLSDAALPGIDLGLSPAFVESSIGGRVRHGLSEGADWLPGRVLVKFKGADAFQILPIDESQDPEAAAARFAAREDVEYAQADYVARYHFRPNDPLFGEQWNLGALGMEQAWDINTGGSEAVVVAVLDGGVAYDTTTYEYNTLNVISAGRRYASMGRIAVPFAAAPDLAGPNRFVAPRDFIWNDNAPVDLDGHGTHVAGTIGQLTNNNVGVAGVAFNVRLMPVKVISDDWDFVFGAPNVGTTAVVASGIRYAADNGAKVINMSIGFPSTATLPTIEEALRYAVGRGVFVTVSAGNDFEDGNPTEPLAELAARIDGVISVGAVGRDNNRAFYSSSRSSVEISAPGGNFRVGGASGGVLQQTLDPAFALPDALDGPVSRYGPPRFDVFSFQNYQGTSMAAPHVAGLAALLIQQGLTDPAAIEAALKRFATDRGAAGRDDDFGAGVINPRATLRGLGLAR